MTRMTPVDRALRCLEGSFYGALMGSLVHAYSGVVRSVKGGKGGVPPRKSPGIAPEGGAESIWSVNSGEVLYFTRPRPDVNRVKRENFR